MQITESYERSKSPVAILQINGEVNADNADQLMEASRKALAEGYRNQLFDLSQVPYISSYGIRALSEMFNMLREGQPGGDDAALDRGLRSGIYVAGHLKLLNPTPQVRRVLHVAGVDMFLEIFDNRGKALNAFPA